MDWVEKIAHTSRCKAKAVLDHESAPRVSLDAELSASNGVERTVARVYSVASYSQFVTNLSSLRSACQKLGINFLIVTDGQTTRLYLANSSSSEFLSHVPQLTGVPTGARITLEQLRPLDSIITVKNLASRLADEIFAKHGHDRLRLFDVTLSILTTKVYDEIENPDNLKFVPSQDLAKSFRGLLKRALAKFEVGEWSLEVDLDESTLNSCARILLPFSLIQTVKLGSSSEVLGTFYQEIVTSTFRGSLGAFFTPKPMCEIGVALCRTNGHVNTIFDISSGSGTYLATAYEKVRTTSQNVPTIVGVDIQERMVLATVINLTFHGATKPIGIHSDGLKLTLDGMHAKHQKIPVKGFDMIVGNPPFAGFEVGASLEDEIKTQQRGAGARVHKVIPFVVKVVEFLAPDGVASLVVPTSVLNAEAEQFVMLRKQLLEMTHVEAIVTFPRDALVHTGTGVESAILVLRRKNKNPRPPGPVFVMSARNLGYDRRGLPIPGSEVEEIARKFADQQINDSCWVSYTKLTKAERWDPLWLATAGRPAGLSEGDMVRLTDIADVTHRKISKESLPLAFTYFEVGDCDSRTGRIVTHNGDRNLLARKGRLRQIVKAGDVLLPNHRDSLLAKTYSETGRSAVVVTKELGGCITTDRFIILESKLDPLLLRAILNTEFIRSQLVRYARGSASYDIRDKVLEGVWVPKSWLSETRARKVSELEKQLALYESRLAQTHSELRNLFNGPQ